MNKLDAEPKISVGILSGVRELRFHLLDSFKLPSGQRFLAGLYKVYSNEKGMEVVREGDREPAFAGSELELVPEFGSGKFTICDVVIGIGFHWERREDQSFLGVLQIVGSAETGLLVINRIDIEKYLTSVISSEMSETAHPELLRAHAVISRSWLLAQLPGWRLSMTPSPAETSEVDEIIRWYDRENHEGFDVCADDHCQRYQGVTKAITTAAQSATESTAGLVLSFGGRLCDARFSKSCGGVTERFGSAWADIDVPYLTARYDGDIWPSNYEYPPKSESAAAKWILGHPPSYCSPPGDEVLSRILPGFDQETPDYYRWTLRLTQSELRQLIGRKLGLDLGHIIALEPVERGDSGRIIRLRLRGDQKSVVIGKELEIRRSLSPSHLYSSAFVIESEIGADGIPVSFTLHGAGWGHGVGLCQIGAAVMAENGYDYGRILRHYFYGANLELIY